MSETKLTHKEEIRVRFNDADPMNIVWHGNYLQYMEDGREAFGEHLQLGYPAFYSAGCEIPIVNVNIDYKLPLRYGENAIVEAEFVDTIAAKIVFNYKIYRSSDGKLAAVGQTTQVMIDKDTNELALIVPKFYQEWKNKYLNS